MNTAMRLSGFLVILGLAAQEAPVSKRPALDYEFFRDRVQPIFLNKRAGHARCVTCHQHQSPPLLALTPGATTWNEEQSRKNFQMWRAFVVPGKPMSSKMLLHPLAASAGGDHFHAGGKHWMSQDDPEWRILASWVNGATLSGSGGS